MRLTRTFGFFCLTALILAAAFVSADSVPQPVKGPPATATPAAGADIKQFVSRHCGTCHNSDNPKGGLDLDKVSGDDVAAHSEVWEKVVRKLTTRQMPPAGKPRPDEQTYDALVTLLESRLDRMAAAQPNPGRTPTLRRLNRTEYQNAIRDLLALDIDAAALLPADEANHGFDSAPLGDLSPTLLDRYITAAQRISRLAVGRAPKTPNSDTFRPQPDLTQEGHVEGLPVGTRGGMRVPYVFPRDGEYDVQVWLTRDRNENVEGLREPHELQFLIDRKHMASFTVKPAKNNEADEKVDAKLKARITVSAGPHDLGVTFLQNPASLLETKRQPYQAHYNLHRHPRITPALYQVSITGPYNPTGQAHTPSHQRIFICEPTGPKDEEYCAKKILAPLVRRAYRRPVEAADLDKALKFFRQGRKEEDFDTGIEMALSSILVNPQFLFRVEQTPAGLATQGAYQVSDLDLASRLSFFLWSSLPDDVLLDLAARGELHKPEVFEKQVRRLARGRAFAQPRHQLCRAMAPSTQSAFDHAGPAAIPGLRR